MTDTAAITDQLPPGVHPYDQAGDEWSPPQGVQGQQWQPGRAPFSVPNANAVPVWQRATTDWSTAALTLNSTNGTQQIAGRVTGRMSVTIWVPGIASHGIQFSQDRGAVDNNAGTPLNPGDSVTINSEGPVYAGCQSGQTAGTVYVLDLFNVTAPVPE